MTDTPKTGNWPDPNAPGVPANPERDGWHWLRRRISGQWFSVVLHWQGGWIVAGGAGFIYPEALAAQGVEYLGPCLTPAEVAAREAAAKADGMREAAGIVSGMRKCPFDNPQFSIDPSTPCPVCGDKGDDLDAPVRCSNPAAAILAAIPEDKP